jgi:hypothetical protein
MGADYVRIANFALAALGESVRITEPDQAGAAPEAIARVWDMVRRAVLRDHRYNFATKRFNLAAQNITDPADVIAPWAYAYPVPDEFLRLVEIVQPSVPANGGYEFEGGRILTSVSGPLLVKCIVDVPETGAWDDLSVIQFARRLAFEIADDVSGDRGRKNAVWAEYTEDRKRARNVDGLENPPQSFVEDDWISARGQGGSISCIVWPNP